MERHGFVFVTDQRQFYLSEYLGKNRRTIRETEISQSDFCEHLLAAADFVILPTPVSKINDYKLDISLIQQCLHDEQIVFGGKFPDEWKRSLDYRGICYYDLMEDPEVAFYNAQITAEATIALVISNSKYSVEGQKIMITGYGRCAKAAAVRLSALGARITILARSTQARKQATADGYVALDFAYGPQEACAAGTLINTVPACVVTERIIKELPSDVLILDIASAPGGCDLAAAAQYGHRVIPALSLPAIYTPGSSAGVFADAIRKKTHSEKNCIEEKPWIYQIVRSDMA